MRDNKSEHGVERSCGSFSVLPTRATIAEFQGITKFKLDHILLGIGSFALFYNIGQCLDIRKPKRLHNYMIIVHFKIVNGACGVFLLVHNEKTHLK